MLGPRGRARCGGRRCPRSAPGAREPRLCRPRAATAPRPPPLPGLSSTNSLSALRTRARALPQLVPRRPRNPRPAGRGRSGPSARPRRAPEGAPQPRGATHRLQEAESPHVVALGAEDLVEDAEAEAQLAVGVLGAAGGLGRAGSAGRLRRRLHGGGAGRALRSPLPQEPPMAPSAPPHPRPEALQRPGAGRSPAAGHAGVAARHR